MAVESRRWEAARSVKRLPSASVDGHAACRAPHGPEGRPRVATGPVAERGADGVSSLGRRPTRVASSGVVGKASGASR